MHIEINIPYSIKEVFNNEAHARANELREESLELYSGDKKKAWAFICRPRADGQQKSLLEMSVNSECGHGTSMGHINIVKYGLCA